MAFAEGDGADVGVAVGGDGADPGLVGGGDVVAVDEVEVAVAEFGGEDGVGVGPLGAVPAHLWDFELVGGGEAADGAGEDGESGDAGAFLAGFEEDLEAHADAEEGFVGGDPGAEGVDEAVVGEVGHAVAEGALAGHEDAVEGVDLAGVFDADGADAEGGAGVEDAAEVAHAVVENADHGGPR